METAKGKWLMGFMISCSIIIPAPPGTKSRWNVLTPLDFAVFGISAMVSRGVTIDIGVGQIGRVRPRILGVASGHSQIIPVHIPAGTNLWVRAESLRPGATDINITLETRPLGGAVMSNRPTKTLQDAAAQAEARRRAEREAVHLLDNFLRNRADKKATKGKAK